jgi:hypothetical protein
MKSLKKTVLGMREFECDQVGNPTSNVQVQELRLYSSPTNGIEGYFSHLKNHLDLHRGLTLDHRINFIKWYVYYQMVCLPIQPKMSF